MKNLKDLFIQTRQTTESHCASLETEDFVVQPIVDVSPPKWHLAHTSWFFEQFILVNYVEGYTVFDPKFNFLFNSYYDNVGERTVRHDRGAITRPTVAETYKYRQHVTEAIVKLIDSEPQEEVLKLLEIGINHEQQHQELLAYDIKYILGTQPTYPNIPKLCTLTEEKATSEWIDISEGIYLIGHKGDNFCFDNELPTHKVFLNSYAIRSTLVTNGEYLEFINDEGYQDFNLWLDEGWSFIQNNNISHPLYWHHIDGEWQHYNYSGLEKLDQQLPVSHISMYEAHAFAAWKGMRLPTEFEWEVAAPKLSWGQLWEWTNSAYLPYPGYAKAEGALGEYNGKFMINQMILRGASAATAAGHERLSYRNFFQASSRWIFSGIRLVK